MSSALAQPDTASEHERRNPRHMLWHESVIDWLLLHPDRTQGDCARHFNCSESYLSIILNSHNFQTKLEQRRITMREAVEQTTIGRLKGLADLSVETLTERIAAERDQLPLAEVRDTCEMALKGLGYTGTPGSASQGPGPQLHIHIGKEDLASARNLMRAIPGEPFAKGEGQARHIPDDAPEEPSTTLSHLADPPEPDPPG